MCGDPVIRRRGVAALVAAFAAAGLSLLATPPARADSGAGQVLIEVPGDGHGFVHDSTTPLLDFDRLAPGMTTSADLVVENASAATADLSLRATDVADDDNGCLPPEVRAGDTTCGPGGGDLGRWMQFTVSSVDSGVAHRLWSGTIADLETGAVLEHGVTAGTAQSLRLDATLPHAAGNDTMSDRLGYDLRWTMSSSLGSHSAQVAGERFTRDGTGTSASASAQPGLELPFTGLYLGRTLLLAISLLFAGLTLVLTTRLRRRQP